MGPKPFQLLSAGGEQGGEQGEGEGEKKEETEEGECPGVVLPPPHHHLTNGPW